MIDSKEPGLWGAAAAAIIAGFYWLRHLTRRDKEDGAGSSLNIAVTNATEAVVKMLRERIDELSSEIHKLRAEVAILIKQNQECQRQNQILLGRRTVDVLEKKP